MGAIERNTEFQVLNTFCYGTTMIPQAREVISLQLKADLCKNRSTEMISIKNEEERIEVQDWPKIDNLFASTFV